MSDKKSDARDAEKTLITLDQLSQTIEVMTSVVNRLKRHLNQQLNLDADLLGEDKKLSLVEEGRKPEKSLNKVPEGGLVVEISQQELERENLDNQILH